MRMWSVVLVAISLAACSGGLEKLARQSLGNQLKDPESAQFRNLRSGKPDASGDYMICGEVNAKNELGGYTGFVPFMAPSKPGGEAIIASDPITKEVLKQTEGAACS